MKLEMNIAKKHLYYLAAFVVFVFIIGIAMAQTAVNNPGHPAEQIDEGTIANTLTVSGGNVGIGTTNPDASLVVSGDSVIGLYQTTGTNQRRYQLFSTSSGNGDAGGGKFAIRDAGVAGSAGYRFVINENGNVGIGTTSPIGLLDLSGQTSSDIVFSDKQWWGGVSNPRGRIYSAIDSDQWAGSRLTLQSVVGSGSSYSFIDTMSLKNGNVGIGTANPRGKLQIGDMSGTLGLSTYPGDIILDKDPGGSNGIGGIEFRSSVSAGGAGWKITATGNYLGHKLLFAPRSAGATWETEVLTLTQNGNVGIGTTNPKTKFEISEGGDNIRIFANSMITDNVYYSGGWKNDNTGEGSATMQFDDGKFTFYTREAGAAEGMGTEKVTILSSGNVGIGTTSPAEKLEISNGNLKLTRTTSGGKEGMVIMSSAVAKSACDATTAGAIAYEVTGGGGTNSHFFGCRVDATGAYQWVQLDN